MIVSLYLDMSQGGKIPALRSEKLPNNRLAESEDQEEVNSRSRCADVSRVRRDSFHF